MADQSSENAYQAALVTRDRALQARQESIDVLQRLLAQMGDDPLLVQARENLAKILENPEVITDEVFGNIMSKTAEVLDSNYDQQVSDVLNAARSKGVAGPALQLTLQRAKEARATAIAGAYRDAIIERANTGLSTNLEAINATSNLLNNLFNQQRVVTEDLVNTMQTIVEEPFRNEGPAALPQAAGGGGGGGGGGSTPITMDFSQVDAARARQAAEYEAFKKATTTDYGSPEANGTVYGNQANGQPGTAASVAAAEEAAARAREQAAIDAIKKQYGSNLPSEAKPGTGYITKDGIKYFMDQLGNLKPVTQSPVGSAVSSPVPAMPTAGVPSSQAPVAGPVGLGADFASNLATSASSQIQNALSGALSGLSGIGDQIVQNFNPTSTLKAEQTRIATQPLTTVPGSNVQFSTPGGAAATAAEASRGAQLVQQYGEPAVIGTTSGVGVRYDTTPAGSGKGTSNAYTGPIAPGSGQSAADAAAKAKADAYYKALQGIDVSSMEGALKRDELAKAAGLWNTGAAGATGAGAAAASAPAASWWDAAKKAASGGFTGLGTALAGMFS